MTDCTGNSLSQAGRCHDEALAGPAPRSRWWATSAPPAGGRGLAKARAGGKGVGGPAVRVRLSTRDSYADMFDGDDELEYDPATTAAIVVTGGDGEATADALAACEAAEITTIVMGDEDAPPVVHTDTAKVP